MILTLPKCSPMDSMSRSIGSLQTTQMPLASKRRVCMSGHWKLQSTLPFSSCFCSWCYWLWFAVVVSPLSDLKDTKRKMTILARMLAVITSRLIITGRSMFLSMCQSQSQCLSKNANRHVNQSHQSLSLNPSQRRSHSLSLSHNLDQSQFQNHLNSTFASVITISWTFR